MATAEMNLTVSKTMDRPHLRDLFKGDNSTIAFGVVKTLVKRFLESFTFATKLNETQVEILTVDTLERFSYDSLEDVILFFKMARSGRFGSAKKGIDSNLIFGEWFPQYMELKAIEREKGNEKPEQRRGATEEDIKSYKKRLNKIQYKQKVLDHIEFISKDMDRQMLEDTILDWTKDPKKKTWVGFLKMKRRTIKK